MAIELSDAPTRRPAWLPTLGWGVLAAVPVVAMVVEVLRAPRLHFLDYWHMLAVMTNDDGSLDVKGLFLLHNSHPIVTPRLLFWAEAHITGGSNIVVGLFAVVLAAVAVVGLRAMLPADLNSTKKGALTVGFAFLLFSPGALHTFGFGMSGAAWFLGLVPAVFALLCAHRGHTVAALALGVVANLGYGTAFALWPALALVAWLRGDALWRVLTPLGVAVLAVGAWLAAPESAAGAKTGEDMGLDSLLAAVSGALSPVRVGSDGRPIALALGGAVAVILVGFAVLAIRERLAGPAVPRPDAGWIGLAVNMLGAVGMIGLSRTEFGPMIGLTPRYAVLANFAACAVLALVVLRKPELPRVRVAVAVSSVAVATFAAGSLEAVNVRNQYPNQQLVAVAMRVGADTVVEANRISPAEVRDAERVGVYPFTDDFELGCGIRLGASIPRPSTGLGHVDTGPVRGDELLKGWALVDGHKPECVFVVDGAGKVVGGGYTGLPRPDIPGATKSTEELSGWVAVAGPSVEDGTVVVSSGGRFYRL